jgi:hypothetical protein
MDTQTSKKSTSVAKGGVNFLLTPRCVTVWLFLLYSYRNVFIAYEVRKDAMGSACSAHEKEGKF